MTLDEKRTVDLTQYYLPIYLIVLLIRELYGQKHLLLVEYIAGEDPEADTPHVHG